MPIFGFRNVNSVKTKRQKSPYDILFFPRFFTKKLMFSSLYPYFIQKRPIFNALMSFFFNFFHEKPPAVIPIISQKTSVLSKLMSIMGHKSQQNAFFSKFSRENRCYHTNILSKKSILSKIHCSQALFFFKKRPFSKTG